MYVGSYILLLGLSHFRLWHYKPLLDLTLDPTIKQPFFLPDTLFKPQLLGYFPKLFLLSLQVLHLLVEVIYQFLVLDLFFALERSVLGFGKRDVVFLFVLLGLDVGFWVVVYCHLFGVDCSVGLLDVDCWFFLTEFLQVFLLDFFIYLSFGLSADLLLFFDLRFDILIQIARQDPFLPFPQKRPHLNLIDPLQILLQIFLIRLDRSIHFTHLNVFYKL